MVKVFISDEKKPIRGRISNIRHIEKRNGGYILSFGNYDSAYKAAKVFYNSDIETVKILSNSPEAFLRRVVNILTAMVLERSKK